MKKLISTFILFSFTSICLAQSGGFTGGTHTGSGRSMRDFQDQRQSLIDSFMGSRDPRNNIGQDGPGSTPIDGDDIGNVRDNQDSQPQVDSRRVFPYDNSQNYKIDVPEPNGEQEQETAPLRLYFDQIQLDSNEVSEVTLKDGTVVTTRELQEFAKKVIIKKLNEQK